MTRVERLCEGRMDLMGSLLQFQWLVIQMAGRERIQYVLKSILELVIEKMLKKE